VTSAEVVERHRSAGRFFDVAGVRSFVLDEGEGDPVVCLHGVPSSCFLYRKVPPGRQRPQRHVEGGDLRVRRSAQARGRRSRVPEDNAALRAHAKKRALYESTVRDAPYPVQIVWGAEDPALRLAVHGEQVRKVAGLDEIHAVPAKHFLQEEQAPAIAERVAALAAVA
jgi:pimeloyl-ACP methyl ester carboxylesterase